MSLIRKIRRGDFKRIIICSGAGVSTGAGIPDYRSSDGIFQRFSEFNLSQPSDIFSRWFQDEHPEFVDHPEYRKLLQKIEDAEPTAAHQLATWLFEKGWLKRVYTQNIDGLYQKAGLPDEVIVEFHGNLKSGVVLYGDPIPEMCISTLKNDHHDALRHGMEGCDLMLVMGTSLQVAPFCGIPNMVPRSCVRSYVDLYPSLTNSFGGGYYTPAQTTKFHQKVSLQARWNSGHYLREYIIEMDCSRFSEYILSLEEPVIESELESSDFEDGF